MTQSQVLVRMKTRDPQAMTAYTTLTTRLGHAGALKEIDRAVYTELGLPADDARDAQRSLRRLLEATTLLANPNKELAEAAVEPNTLAGGGLRILVWDREGPAGERLAERIRREFPEIGPVSAKQGVVWTPVFDAPEDRWWQLAERLTLSTKRLSGLLVNPHASRHRLFTGSIPHGFLHRDASGNPS